MAPPARMSTRLIGIAAGLVVALQPPAAQAGLLRPLLLLMRPQLENRLARACVQAAAGENSSLAARLEDPCRKLAVPTSKCLIEETETSGRSIGVLSELVAGRFGDDSEVVVKRCLARLFGLPADSLRDVPLQDLARRFGSLGQPPPSR